MKDMFFNYDNCIDKKTYDTPIIFGDKTRKLESPPAIEPIIDIKGNEVGVRARHLADFTLYFNLDCNMECADLDTLVYNSTVSFQILNHKHEVVVEKTLATADIYCNGTLAIYISQTDAEKLKPELYHLNVALIWPGGGYNIFAEPDGMLAIK